MTDSLRDKMAKIAERHGLGWIDNGTDHARCYCGHSPRLGDSWHWHVADAVIRELGLRVQVAGPDGIVGTGKYRYVTDWIDP